MIASVRGVVAAMFPDVDFIVYHSGFNGGLTYPSETVGPYPTNADGTPNDAAFIRLARDPDLRAIGYLPALTIGFSPTDSSGYAIDHWGNRIRYAVSATSAPHFTSNTTMQSNGTATAPADIDICKHLTAANQTTCTLDTNRAVTFGTVASVIWSQGKNYAAAGAASIDEGNNNDAFRAFVSRTPSPSESTEGEFDDQLVWIPVGLLYSRLIAAGRLP